MIDSIFVALSGMLGHERGLNVISDTNHVSPAPRSAMPPRLSAALVL